MAGNPNWGRKGSGGKSGNPGGRKSSAATFEVRQLAQQHTAEAIERLAFWMRSEEPKASVQAAMALLDRGWGKPQTAEEAATTAAKLKLLEAGHDPEAATVTVIIPSIDEIAHTPEPAE